MRPMLYTAILALLALGFTGGCNKREQTAQAPAAQVATGADELRSSANDPASWTPAPLEDPQLSDVEPLEAPDEAGADPMPGPPSGSEPPLEMLSLPLIDFDFRTFDDESRTLSDYKGRPLVLNFWADWCPPCMMEMPHFAEVYRERAGQFELVSITDSSSRDPRGYVSSKGFEWVFGLSDDAPRIYDLEAWPTTLFIDSNGVIRNIAYGAINAEQFEQRLELIL